MSTANQAIASGILDALKLERFQDDHPTMGGPEKWQITKGTVEKVEAMEGKIFVVDNDGNVTEE